ncbi:flagellar assembly protein FliW [Niveibacterium sp. SC-1]|uniref:flagellar assembly protein FliW n=1 Tax=Niveibacterium sp. SC-1 TaxID=3135646 RepID=UPI00311D5C1A
MKVASPRFGDLDISDDKVIQFPGGLPGFEDCQQFALVHPDGQEPRLFYLQSLDQPEVSFSIASPDQFGLHYEFSLTDAEMEKLSLDRPDDAAVMVILRRENPESDNGAVRAVLTAPLIINLAKRIGLQKPMSHMGCDITLRA